MARKHVIYIHGRAPKPAPEAFAGVIHASINAGLKLEHERLHASGPPPALPAPAVCGPGSEPAPTIEAPLPIFHNTSDAGAVFSLAYYGDISGRLMADKAAEKETFADRHFWRRFATDFKRWLEEDAAGNWYDKPVMASKLLEQLDALVSVPGDPFSKRRWKAVRDQAGPSPILLGDNAGRTLDPVLRLPWVGRRIEDFVRPKFPDLYAYLKMRYFGSSIRHRLQSVLLGALARGDEVCLVSHSLGTLVAYDVLWKIGWMSEYEAFRSNGGGRITQLITMGSPLGWSVTQPYLYDGGEFETFKYPPNIEGTWHNIAAEDDPIAYDQSLEDDFAALEKRKSTLFGGRTKIRDHLVYNPCFSPDRETSGATRSLDPHAEIGYLAHRTTAGLLTDWLG